MSNHNVHRNNHRQRSLPADKVLPAHLMTLHEQIGSNTITGQTAVVGNWVLSQDPTTGNLLATWTFSGTTFTLATPDTPPPTPVLRPGISGVKTGNNALPPQAQQQVLLTRVQQMPSELTMGQ